MIDFIRAHAAKVAAVMFTLGNVTGCTVLPQVVPGAASAVAVKEVCLTERTPEESAFCLIGTYNAAVGALAVERSICREAEAQAEAGIPVTAECGLPASVEKVLDRTINAVSPRLAATQELWSKVAFYRAEVDTLRPLAEKCVEAFEGSDKLTGCMAAVGYSVASGELTAVTKAAKEDFGTVKPLLLEVIYAKEAL